MLSFQRRRPLKFSVARTCAEGGEIKIRIEMIPVYGVKEGVGPLREILCLPAHSHLPKLYTCKRKGCY